MAEFESFESGVEVNGQTVLAFIEGVPAGYEDKAYAILEQHGIEEPEPGEWYPQDAWLDAFEEMEGLVGEATLTRAGSRIPETADWPSDINLVVGALELIDEAYQLNHRGGDIGYYDVQQVSEDTVQVHCKNPYPCPFDQGVVQAVAESAAFQNSVYMSEVSDHCRRDGGEECTYEIKL